MAKNVMLVFSAQDSALNDRLHVSLASPAVNGRSGVNVVSCRDMNTVLAMAREMRIDFFVIGLALARDPQSRVEEEGGLALCQSLRNHAIQQPIALIAPQVGAALANRYGSLGQVNAYYPGANLDALLIAQIDNYTPPAKTLDLILNVKQGEQWEYRLLGTHFEFNRVGVVPIDPTFLRLAQRLSQVIGQINEDWYGTFQELGKAIIQQLCLAKKFKQDLDEGIERAGPIEQTRITLAVDKANYEIALEAIFPPEPQPDVPWMVRAPLHRNVSNAGPGECARTLFSPAMAPLKVLVICADVDGIVNKVWDRDGKSIRLGSLKSVRRECDGLRKRLIRHGQDLTVAQIEQLPCRDGDALSKRSLLEKLQSDEWDIVHFAGHSLSRFEEHKESRGYLFVGARGTPEPIEISEIASYLARTRLVYLSSCQSASAAFAVELAQRGVPTVIGFRWRVDDDFAALHAHLFYRYLFQRRHISTAFLNTRRAIYGRYSRRDRVWASSMLVMGAQR